MQEAARSEHLDDFVTRLNGDIPIYAAGFKRALEPFMRAVTMPEIRHATSGEAPAAIASVRRLAATQEQAIESYRGMRDTIGSVPRVTTLFNHAKRRAVDSINHLIEEFEKSLRLTKEMEAVLIKIAGGKDPLTESPNTSSYANRKWSDTSDGRISLWKIREELAPMLAIGIGLKNKCGHFGQANIDHQAFSVDAHKRANEVENYLLANVGQMAVVKFQNRGYTGQTSNPGIGWNNFMFISARVAGLQHVLDNLSDYIKLEY